MTQVTLIRRMAARPSIVFDALLNPEAIACWWGPDAGPVLAVEVDARIGGRFRIRFRKLDGLEHECSGEYLAIEPHSRIATTWRWLGGAEDPGESRLEFRLRPIADGVELTLTHALLANEDSRRSHTEGWSGALDKLAAFLSRPGAALAPEPDRRSR